MTIKGKRKALDNDPEKQIAGIASAFNGKIPVKPLPRRYPGAVWQEDDNFHVIKLRCGKLYHLVSKAEPLVNMLFSDARSACGYLAQTYHRKVSLTDLQAALAGPVPVPTLAESQQAIITWVPNREQARQSRVPIWQYCVVTPDGIWSGIRQGKPKPPVDYPAPLIVVENSVDCEDLLRRAFQLDIQGGELKESFNKWVRVPKILASRDSDKTIVVAAPDSNSNLSTRTKSE